MKHFLGLILLTNFAFANYSIYFNGIELGKIDNFNSVNSNYLEAKVTNKIARFLLGKDKFVFYNEDYIGTKKEKNTKYKKDKYAIIEILKKAYSKDVKPQRIQVKEDKFIDVTFDKNYKFIYNSKDRVKSKGYFVMKDDQLEILIETVNNIEISKN